MSTPTGAAAALVFHLVVELGDLGSRPFDRDFLFHLRCYAFIRGHRTRFDLADLDQCHAEAALYRLAHLAGWQRKRRVRNRGIDDRGFGDDAEVDVGEVQVALLGEVVERRSGGDAAPRGERFFHARKHHLLDFALLGRADLVAALLENLLRILVGDLGPLADLLGIDRDKRQFAVFGCAELGLVVVEIGGERLG